MMVTQHINVDAHKSPPPVEMRQSPPPLEMRPATKKSQQVNNFTIEEDNMLVSAWLNTSLDEVLVNDQKHKQFWKEFGCTSLTTSNLNLITQRTLY